MSPLCPFCSACVQHTGRVSERWRPRGWSLARQLLTLQVVVVTVVVLVGVGAAYLQARSRSEASARERVLGVARAVAAQDSVREALAGPDPASVLQPLAERVRRDTGTDFVVVMGTDRTRYSHPNPALLGQPFIGHIEAALRGGSVLETYTGTLGPSERAVVPVRTSAGTVAGLVAVGIRREALSRQESAQLPTLLGAGLVALALSGLGSALVARRVRRQTHGLGPAELARMYEFYDAVLHAVHEGLLLLDTDGRLQMANDEARRLLALPADGVGRRIDDVGLPAVLAQALLSHQSVHDDVHLTGERVVVVNQAPARWEGTELGSVVTLRDHTELQALAGELDTVRSFAEALRSQAHESANRLHSMVSLIELGRSEQALTFATAELAAAQQLTDTVVAAVEEPVLAALLLGKVAEASERAVELTVDPTSAVPEGALEARAVVTIVGNLLDNAIDAAGAAGRVRFSGWVDDVAGADGICSTLVLQVADSGPGLSETVAAQAFTRGWSTKSDVRLAGRGLGLALVGQTVHRHAGTVDVGRDDHLGGALFTVRLPLAACLPA